jgi:protein-tyrosine phosphatase
MWNFLSDVFGLTGGQEYFSPQPTPVAALVKDKERDEVRRITRSLDDVRKWPRSLLKPDPFNHIIAVDGSSNKSLPSLYLGSVKTLSEHPEFLQHIGAVVSVIDADRFPKKLLLHYVGRDRGYLYIDIDDDRHENLGQYFDQTHDFIKRHLDRGYNVYVHCVAGMSRSSSIVVAFLMKEFGYTAEEALNYVKRKRPIIRPNSGFIRQLLDYQRKLKI